MMPLRVGSSAVFGRPRPAPQPGRAEDLHTPLGPMSPSSKVDPDCQCCGLGSPHDR